VVVAVELSRLLRRGLLVVGIAAVGWLLGLAFAGTASADELPGENTQVRRDGGLLSGLTSTLDELTTGLTDITDSVVGAAGDRLSPNVTAPAEPIVDLPSLLPIDGSAVGGSNSSGGGSAITDRGDVPRAEADPAPETPVVAPPPAPESTPVAHAAPPVVVLVPVAPVTPAGQDSGNDSSAATEHVDQRGSDPRPVKTPAAPAGSGTTVSTTHDSSGGARGTHGVLTSQATLHPADAGFTTRSRAVDAAGRIAGLPASSPD
jgi:hypothetical protein